MKNNRLTLKALKSELELLKSSSIASPLKIKTKPGISETNSHNAEVAGHDIKGSYINRIYMKSSMFYLWLLTGVLGYATKIPYIGRIVSLLGLWYGKTTIWKILVKIRKMFVIFNAIIGVFVVFKTVGFSYENVLAGFAGMGHTYLEIFMSFTKRLFNWIFDIFDYKVVPNVPNTPPSTTPSWWPGQGSSGLKTNLWIDEYLKQPLNKDWFPNPSISININPQPWYKDLNTWLWIGGSLALAGLSYFGYKFVTDPTFIDSVFKSSVSTDVPTRNGPPGPSTGGLPADSASDATSISEISKSIGTIFTKSIKKLNPYNWFMTASTAQSEFQNFMNSQNNMQTQDNRYYPFTEVNPFRPWYDRIRISMFGETHLEKSTRITARTYAWRDMLALGVKNTKSAASSAPISPHIAAVGIGKDVSEYFDGVGSSHHDGGVFERLRAVTSIPSTSLTPLPDVESGNWDIKNINLSPTTVEKVLSTAESKLSVMINSSEMVEEVTQKTPTSLIKGKGREFTLYSPTPNKFDILDIE